MAESAADVAGYEVNLHEYTVGDANTGSMNTYLESCCLEDSGQATPLVEIPDLDDIRYQVTEPLLAQIAFREGEYQVQIPELGVYAFDESLDDAMIDIVADVVQLCEEVLDKRESELGMLPRLWKRYLLQHIKLNA